MIAVLLFILILSFLVIIHELGHFLVARWRGVQVNEFGLGYPPQAFKLFTWKGTVFSLNWIPFGGFVRLEGEEGEAAALSSPATKAFFQQSAWGKLAIILAGPIVNFVFAIVAFSIVFSISGIPQPLHGQPRIENVMAGSPALMAQLPLNVTILGFQDPVTQALVSTNSINAVQQYVAEHKGQTVMIVFSGPCSAVTCEAGQTTRQIYLRQDYEIPEHQGSMGVIFAEYYIQRYPWYLMPLYGSLYGVTQALDLGTLMVQSLGQIGRDLLMAGKVSTEVAGPIGIVHQAQQSDLLTSGWLSVLGFAGMLSLNLAVMNVLPIPALDGGRAAFIVLGGLLGQRRIERWENYANYGGFILLILLIVLVSVRDVQRIFQGG